MTAIALLPNAADVQRLNDTHLRELVVRLCRSELNASGFAIAGLTAGGDQNAADGGVDVRVEWDGGPTKLGYLICSPCLIQVKAEVMTRAKIHSEMAPGGALRPALIDAARRGGSYIITSGHDRCSDLRLAARKAAMLEARGFDPTAEALALDFRDATQLADWAGQHAGVAAWLMAQAGRPTTGWKPWGAWSTLEEGEEVPYLIDDQDRAVFGGPGAPLIPIPEAIARVRHALHPARGTVRLVGLSGMGKTRLAQALFDPSVGDGALEKTAAIYGDVGEVAEVTPIALAERLVAEGAQATLVVDNCPSDLHRALTRRVGQEGSRLSLLTLDYDVGPDQPENTVVVRLERAGDGLIEQLLRRRHPELSSADRIRAAQFSEGNARIALVIARSATTAGSVAALDDQQLLDRLFLAGRRNSHPRLRSVAKAASLVYAFDVEIGGEDAEIPTFLKYAGVTEGEFFEALNELLDRGMAQKRGSQRALLPQALAARLAREALRGQSTTRLKSIYVDGAPLRLFVSFTRRLSLLHESAEAVDLARGLLAPGGRLSNLSRLDDKHLDAFAYLAPLAPKEVLVAMETALAHEDNAHLLEPVSHARQVLQKLAYQLAYDAPLFRRAAQILGRVVLSEPSDHRRDSAKPLFSRLFGLTHSGTKAVPADRFALIEQLFSTRDDGDERLGLLALKTALGSGDHGYGGGWDFGARSRDEGWRPQTQADVETWCVSVLSLAVRVSRQTEARKALVRSLFTQNFWRLCMWMRCVNTAATAAVDFAGDAFWPEGWAVVCRVLASETGDGGHLSAAEVEILDRLQETLAPRTMAHRFEAWAEGRAKEWDDPKRADQPKSYEAPFQFAEQLGRSIGADPALWPTYLPKAVRYYVNSRLFSFGRGLVLGSTDLDQLWRVLTETYRATPATERSADVLCGVVCEAEVGCARAVGAWLQAALLDPDLAPEIVRLQAAAGFLDQAGAERLTRAARMDTVPVASFHWLQLGRTTENLELDALDALLRALAERDEGVGQAIDILSMRFHGLDGDEQARLKPLLGTGRHLLTRFPFTHGAETMRDHHLGQIAQICLVGEEAAEDSRTTLCHLIEAFKTTDAWLSRYTDVLSLIIASHPRIALEELFDQDLTPIDAHRLGHALTSSRTGAGPRDSLLSAISDQEMLSWMEQDPVRRAPKLARYGACLSRTATGELAWTPLALRLMEQEPIGAILEAFDEQFHSGIEEGSFAARFARIKLIVAPLRNHYREEVRAWAEARLVALDDWIVSYSERERSEFAHFE